MTQEDEVTIPIAVFRGDTVFDATTEPDRSSLETRDERAMRRIAPRRHAAS